MGPPHHHPGHRMPHPGINEHPPWGGPQHPDFGPPPHGFNGQPPHMRRQGPPHINHDDPSLVPNVPYFDLPAGLMAPLVKVRSAESSGQSLCLHVKSSQMEPISHRLKYCFLRPLPLISYSPVNLTKLVSENALEPVCPSQMHVLAFLKRQQEGPMASCSLCTRLAVEISLPVCRGELQAEGPMG